MARTLSAVPQPYDASSNLVDVGSFYAHCCYAHSYAGRKDLIRCDHDPWWYGVGLTFLQHSGNTCFASSRPWVQSPALAIFWPNASAAQWLNTCLASSRPWVQSPALAAFLPVPAHSLENRRSILYKTVQICITLIAQLGERQTEDLKVSCTIHD